MRARIHDDILVWIERRQSEHYVHPPARNLNEVNHPSSPVLVPPSEWKRVDERNPRVTECEGRVGMYGGFTIEGLEENTHDYRVCIKRSSKEEWPGDLKVAISIDSNEIGTAVLSGTSSELAQFELIKNKSAKPDCPKSDPEVLESAIPQVTEDTKVEHQDDGWPILTEREKETLREFEPPEADDALVIAPAIESATLVSEQAGCAGANDSGQKESGNSLQKDPTAVPHGGTGTSKTSDKVGIFDSGIFGGIDLDPVFLEELLKAVNEDHCEISTAEHNITANAVEPDDTVINQAPGENVSVHAPTADLECIFNSTAIAESQNEAAIQDVSVTVEPTVDITPSDQPLRLLNSPESLLGTLELKVLRGSMRAQNGKTGNHFDPDGKVATAEWVAVDENDSPWVTFTYQYGPQAVWDATTLAITEDIRIHQQKAMAERLAWDLKAQEHKAAIARRRAAELERVTKLQARQKEDLEKAAEEKAKVMPKSKKGKEKAIPALPKASKASTKAQARPPVKGFKAPVPKQSKKAGVADRGEVLAPPTPSFRLPEPTKAKLRTPWRVDNQVSKKSTRHAPSTSQAGPSRTIGSVPRNTGPGESSRSCHVPSAKHRTQRPASAWSDEVLVPSTPSRPRLSSPIRKGRNGQGQEPLFLPHDDEPDPEWSRSVNPKSHGRKHRHDHRSVPSYTVDDMGRLQPRRPITNRHHPYPRPHEADQVLRRHTQRGDGNNPNPMIPEQCYNTDRRRRSDGPRAYGLTPPSRHRGRSSPRFDHSEEQDLGLIEAQQRAYELRAEERERKRRRIERKEARRAAAAQVKIEGSRRQLPREQDGRAYSDRRPTHVSRTSERGRGHTPMSSHRETPPVNRKERSEVDLREIEKRRKAASYAALMRQQAHMTRGIRPREVIDLTLDSD